MDNEQKGQRPNQSAEKTGRATVARGRSIDVPDPETRQIAGYTPEGKTITKLATRQYGPGQEVELPVREIVSLRARGFLTDPDQTIPPLADGPRFTETGPHAAV